METEVEKVPGTVETETEPVEEPETEQPTLPGSSESILTSIKKLLGIGEEYEHFDLDIIIHINSVLMILTQLGVGPKDGFSIRDSSSVWTDFITTDQLEAVKSYVFLKVRLLFDPPQSSAAIESINRLISEFEWRLNVAADITAT